MIDGVRWPALLAGRAATLASVMAQLDRSQWLPAEEIEALQFGQLEALLSHCSQHVPYYRDRLAEAGIAAGTPITRAKWERIPVLGRSEIQERAGELRSAAVPESHGTTGEVATSGSTGRPIRVLRTELTGFFWDALTLRAHDWHQWDESATMAAIKYFPSNVGGFPEGMRLPDWGSPYTFVCESGPSAALSVMSSVTQQVEWLERVQPDYLTVFPSVLPEMIRECAERGVRLTRLRKVRTVGEYLDPSLRTLCREQWGVPVQDIYSAQETGYIALQCPEYEHYHVQSECVRVEVLDERGKPCGPGETGRVVVTPLHNFAMPLLRYAIGDYAEVGQVCPCGRGLPVINRILGRVRNMLVLADGARYWPLLGSGRLANVAPVLQQQFVQKSFESIEVKLVTSRPLTSVEEARLREYIQARLPVLFDVRFSYHDSIPRSTGGKFEDFVSELVAR